MIIKHGIHYNITYPVHPLCTKAYETYYSVNVMKLKNISKRHTTDKITSNYETSYTSEELQCQQSYIPMSPCQAQMCH